MKYFATIRLTVSEKTRFTDERRRHNNRSADTAKQN